MFLFFSLKYLYVLCVQAYQPRYMDMEDMDGMDEEAEPTAALDIHSLKAGGIINIGTQWGRYSTTPTVYERRDAL